MEEPSVRSVVVLLLFVSLFLAFISSFDMVKAEPRRVVVPDDCGCVFEAVDAVEDGGTVFVRSGVYFGPVNRTLVINKSISLVGEDPETTVLNLHPPWVRSGWWGPDRPRMVYKHPIIIEAERVRISGFTIATTVQGLQKLRLEGVGTQITGNILETGLFLSYSEQNVTGNIVKGTISCIGHNHTIARNTLEGSIWTMAGGIVIEGNRISNQSVAIAIVGGGARKYIVGNTIEGCDRAMTLMSANNLIFNNNFINVSNPALIKTGNSIGGSWDNGARGNYWSDYNGTDVDGDGIGDTPYVIDEYNQDNYPLMSPVDITVDLDFTPPSISIFSPCNVTYHTNRVVLNFTVSEPASWMGYSLNGQQNITLTQNTSLQLPEGDHKLVLYAEDYANNTGSSHPVYFTVDTPPAITLLAPENRTYSASRVDLNFTTSESLSWVGYSLDGGGNVTVTGNTTLSGLTEDVHALTVYANDTTGNMAASGTVYFTVDEPIPVVLWVVVAMGIVVGVVVLWVYQRKVKKHSEAR